MPRPVSDAVAQGLLDLGFRLGRFGRLDLVDPPLGAD
jgi:hypothetical protein